MVQKIMYYLFDICWIFGLALSCILAAQVHTVPDGPDQPTAIVSKVGADAPVECNQKASRRKAGRPFLLFSILFFTLLNHLPPNLNNLTSLLLSHIFPPLLFSLLPSPLSSHPVFLLFPLSLFSISSL